MELYFKFLLAGLCANCGLGRAYWAETCAPRVVDLSGRLSPFSESDVAWLRSLQIATPNEEPVVDKAQKALTAHLKKL